LVTCNKSIVEMGDGSWRGGSWEVAKLTTTVQLKMEDSCIICNVIEIFCWRKVTKIEEEGLLILSNSKWHWHNCVKTHSSIYVDIQILPLLRGGINQQRVSHDSFVFWLELHRKQQILGWHKIREVNPLMLGWQWQCQLKCVCHL